MSDLQVTPVPDEEEMAAIAAAIQAVMLRPVVVLEAESTAQPAWRFSGRWWTRPIAARRVRPWS